ncbi:MAG: hypothetical protein IJY86_09995 [Clostridia bacterium]|nr:hypothetical protein [Clostridia bacterium]
MKNNFPYADIVDLPRPVSKNHPEATMSDRAARFSPFAAITGYEEMVQEAARVTQRRIDLSEDEKARLNEKLNALLAGERENPGATFTYFVEDEKKSGGAYVTVSGKVRRVDLYFGWVELLGGERIPFEDILEIETEG